MQRYPYWTVLLFSFVLRGDSYWSNVHNKIVGHNHVAPDLTILRVGVSNPFRRLEEDPGEFAFPIEAIIEPIQG